MAERRKRIKQPEIRRFVELLDGLIVLKDSQSVTESVGNILPLAREYGLAGMGRELSVPGTRIRAEGGLSGMSRGRNRLAT